MTGMVETMRVVSTSLVLAMVWSIVARAEPAATGPTEPPHAQLTRGIALHREAGYAASVAALEQARASRGLSASEQVECAFYLAADYLALGSVAAARRELHKVVELQPGYEPPA